MDETRFDIWVKSRLVVIGTRRSILHGFLGGAASLTAGILGLTETRAKKKKTKKKRKCPPARKCGRKCCTPKQQCTSTSFSTGRCVTRTPSNPDPICAGIHSCCSTRECGADCICQTTIEGGGFCLRLGAPGCGAPCTSSDECGDGVCISYAAGTSCGANVCCDNQAAVCTPNSSRCDAG